RERRPGGAGRAAGAHPPGRASARACADVSAARHRLVALSAEMAASAQSILSQLVRIPSAPGHEEAVAECFAGCCEAAGLEVEMQEVEPGRANVVAHWRVGRGPRLLLTGPLDTVPVGEGWTRDPFGAEIAGGRLYGRG